MGSGGEEQSTQSTILLVRQALQRKREGGLGRKWQASTTFPRSCLACCPSSPARRVYHAGGLWVYGSGTRVGQLRQGEPSMYGVSTSNHSISTSSRGTTAREATSSHVFLTIRLSLTGLAFRCASVGDESSSSSRMLFGWPCGLFASHTGRKGTLIVCLQGVDAEFSPVAAQL